MKVMAKCVLILATVFMLTPAVALAHTGLQSSNPASGEIVQIELKNIALEFNTKVENLSTLTLMNEQGQEVPVTVSLDGSVMQGTLTDPLPNGNYTIEWKIVGEDGHPIKGEVSFQVELPIAEEGPQSEPLVPEDQTDEEGTDDAIQVPESSTEQSEEQPAVSGERVESSGEANGSVQPAPPAVYLIGGFVLFFIVAGIARLLIVKRRKT